MLVKCLFTRVIELCSVKGCLDWAFAVLLAVGGLRGNLVFLSFGLTAHDYMGVPLQVLLVGPSLLMYGSEIDKVVSREVLFFRFVLMVFIAFEISCIVLQDLLADIVLKDFFLLPFRCAAGKHLGLLSR